MGTSRDSGGQTGEHVLKNTHFPKTHNFAF